MKKAFAILSVFVALICCTTSCKGRSIYAMEREAKEEAIYDRGYETGYKEGYRTALSDAPERIEFYVEEDIWNLCHDIEDAYGIHPEKAAQILSNYADDPDAVTKEELNKAIWAIYRYYYDSREIMNDIEDYWID